MKSPTPTPAAQVAQSERGMFEAARALVAAFDDPTCSLASLMNYVRDLDRATAALARPVAQSEPILSEADVLKALGTVTHEVPQRLPLGWLKFARAIESAVRAALASRAPASGTFDRRWSLARDGFGLQRNDESGEYVAHDDAVAVIHAALSQVAAGTPAIPPQGDAEKLKGGA